MSSDEKVGWLGCFSMVIWMAISVMFWWPLLSYSWHYWFG